MNTLIIHRNLNLSSYNKATLKTSECYSILNKALKNGAAIKLIDTDETLMYTIKQ